MKKSTIFVSTIFVFSFFINQANAEISSKKLLLDVFDGCVNSEEVDEDLANNNMSAGNLLWMYGKRNIKINDDKRTCISWY